MKRLFGKADMKLKKELGKNMIQLIKRLEELIPLK
jgi:hypothetical protein